MEGTLVSCIVKTSDGSAGYAELTSSQVAGYGDPDDAVTVFEDVNAEIVYRDVAFSELTSVDSSRAALRAHGW